LEHGQARADIDESTKMSQTRERGALMTKLTGNPASLGADAYAGKTVLVTGASGQIGLNIVGLALARGARVIGLYNKNAVDFTHPQLAWAHADLASSDSFPSAPADVLIHTAPIWLLPTGISRFTGGGVRRVIAFSSTSIDGKRDSASAAEQAVVQGLVTAEDRLRRIADEIGLQLTILRPTMIYGMGSDGNISRMARTIRKLGFLPIYNPANGLRQPVQARDLAEAALAAWENPKTFGKRYNLGGNEVLTYRQMVERLFVHLGMKPRFVPLPFLPQLLDSLNACLPVVHINGDVARRMNRDLAFDNGPARQDFGYNPRGFLEGDVII
jgi:nucleoside-diphosphate-sugar epimerase